MITLYDRKAFIETCLELHIAGGLYSKPSGSK